MFLVKNGELIYENSWIWTVLFDIIWYMMYVSHKDTVDLSLCR